MSGSMIFNDKHHRYQLDRIFGKTNRTDKIILTELSTGNRKTLSASQEPGKLFFGVEKETFVQLIVS